MEPEPVDPHHIAIEAAHFLARELTRAGVAGVLTPRLVNPRTQGWVYGFARALGEALGLSASDRYTLEARLYVTLFDGTPMGEQLGLEALAMAQLMAGMTGAKAMMPDWQSFMSQGTEAGRCFAAFQLSVGGLAGSLATSAKR
jgi:hypothetical protein